MRERATFSNVRLLVIALVSGALPVLGATLTVTNNPDSGAGSLRAQTAAAAAGDTIDFSITGTITLTSELVIGKDLTIAGPGAKASKLVISGGGTTRFF